MGGFSGSPKGGQVSLFFAQGPFAVPVNPAPIAGLWAVTPLCSPNPSHCCPALLPKGPAPGESSIFLSDVLPLSITNWQGCLLLCQPPAPFHFPPSLLSPHPDCYHLRFWAGVSQHTCKGLESQLVAAGNQAAPTVPSSEKAPQWQCLPEVLAPLSQSTHSAHRLWPPVQLSSWRVSFPGQQCCLP